MSEGLSDIINIENPKPRMPEPLVYTKEFDRVTQAKDLIDEFWWSPRFIDSYEIPQEIIDNFKLLVQRYKSKNIELYWYVPPITFLLDNSWSLRWLQASILRILMREVSKVFHDEWIDFEVLWHTTRKWRWWESREKWRSDWKPQNPWRLNDLQHTIFRWYWEMTLDLWALDLLTIENYLKENIDWEALRWAYERSIDSKWDKVKHIVYISDWIPSDDSTSGYANSDNNILVDDLEKVLAFIRSYDEKTQVHSFFIWWKESDFDFSKRFSYSSLSKYDRQRHILDSFMNDFFVKLVNKSLEESIEARRKEVREILWNDWLELSNEELTKIWNSFDSEIIWVLKEFGFSPKILLKISKPIKNINKEVLRINLSIFKSCWRWFSDDDLIKLLPLLSRYTYFDKLDFILKNSKSVDDIVVCLNKSFKYIEVIEWKSWAKIFFETYFEIIREDRFDLDILKWLVKWWHITNENVWKIHTILMYWNLKAISFLLHEAKADFDEIIEDKELLSLENTDNLKKNLSYFHYWSYSSSEIKFLNAVNSYLLKVAINFWFNNFKDLFKLQDLLSWDGSEESEIKLVEKILNIKSWFYDVIISFFSNGEHISKRSNNYVKLKRNFEFFNNFVKDFLESIKNNNRLDKKDIKKFKSSYQYLRNYKDSRVDQILQLNIPQILWIDLDKLELEYNIILFFDILYRVPNLEYITDLSIIEVLYSLLWNILKYDPSKVIWYWYNYKFFLWEKSKLDNKIWRHSEEPNWWNTQNIVGDELKKAFELLWVPETSTRDEVISKYRELMKENHTDVWWDNLKAQKINTAKDLIFKHNWRRK